MPGSQKWGTKAQAAALTLTAHVLLLALLLLEKRYERGEQSVAQPSAGHWITLTLPPLPLPSGGTEEKPQPALQESRTRPLPVEPGPTAITLPSTTAPVVGDQPSDPPPSLGINWFEQGARLAAAYAQNVERPPTFSDPPEVMREPCKPRKSSFWPAKPKESVGVIPPTPPLYSEMGPTSMVGGIPIGVVGGSQAGGAVGGGGGLGIRLPHGAMGANKHLFDDMMEGKTPASSVPHHEKCD